MRDETIIDFIEKVQLLENYKFVKTVLNEQTGWRGAFKNNGEFEEILIGPSREEVDAALLIIRQFIQNKDGISIKNIVDLSRDYLTNEAMQTLDEIRDSLNKALDSYPPIGVEGISKNYRELLDIFLYGDHAHTEKNKREVYKEIQATKVPNLFRHYFYVAVRAIIVYSVYIKMLLSDESSYEAV